MIEDASGVPKPRLKLPAGLLRPFMPFIETYYRVTRRPPQFTSSSLKLLSLGVQVDVSRAAAELGYRPRALEETIADSVEWFYENGFARRNQYACQPDRGTSPGLLTFARFAT